MPLLSSVLQSQILTITDPDNGAFGGFPETPSEVGARWAAAARSYFAGITVPVVLPTAFTAGEQAFASAMSAAVATGAGADGLKNGFVAFAAAIAANVAPSPPGVAVPPVGPPPIVFTPPVPPLGPLSASDAAQQLALQVDGWARTGTFTPQTPPGSPPSPWT